MPDTVPSKPKLLVLGTGFAALTLLKKIDPKLYDITVVSPRNHFLFTPLLPSTTVGTLEFRSISEPIRNALPGTSSTFYQAYCVGIDTTTKLVTCRGIHDAQEFVLSYNVLVIAVGAVSKTFGIPGDEEHTLNQ